MEACGGYVRVYMSSTVYCCVCVLQGQRSWRPTITAAAAAIKQSINQSSMLLGGYGAQGDGPPVCV